MCCKNYKVYTVDRIEEGVAVLYGSGEDEEDNKLDKLDILAADLPENVKEGDILRFDCENKTYAIDEEETERIKSGIEERFKNLFKK